MSIILKQDQNLTEKLAVFTEAFEHEDLPRNVKIWISDCDFFGNVFVEGIVSARVISLNIAVDLIHQSVNLLKLDTTEAIQEKVKLLAESARYKYGQIFTLPQDGQ